jgi:hypothetical protein
MGDRWGPEGPPTWAYSRVSDPEAFRPLHTVADEALADLERRYDVVREESVGPVEHWPTRVVRLTPADPGAAPLTVVFTEFPSVRFGFGGGHDDVRLPDCGCDACDETVPELAGVLAERLAALVGGTFGDRLVQADGAWWHEHWFVLGDDSRGGSSRTRLTPAEAESLRESIPDGGRTWRPWPVRQSN